MKILDNFVQRSSHIACLYLALLTICSSTLPFLTAGFRYLRSSDQVEPLFLVRSCTAIVFNAVISFPLLLVGLQFSHPKTPDLFHYLFSPSSRGLGTLITNPQLGDFHNAPIFTFGMFDFALLLG